MTLSGESQCLNALHDRAMELSDQADYLLNKDIDKAWRLYERAFRLEKRVALAVQVEPSRSVILYSAACLAFSCGRFVSAKELCQLALKGNPDAVTHEQLTDLLFVLKDYAA